MKTTITFKLLADTIYSKLNKEQQNTIVTVYDNSKEKFFDVESLVLHDCIIPTITFNSYEPYRNRLSEDNY